MRDFCRFKTIFSPCSNSLDLQPEQLENERNPCKTSGFGHWDGTTLLCPSLLRWIHCPGLNMAAILPDSWRVHWKSDKGCRSVPDQRDAGLLHECAHDHTKLHTKASLTPKTLLIICKANLNKEILSAWASAWTRIPSLLPQFPNCPYITIKITHCIISPVWFCT